MVVPAAMRANSKCSKKNNPKLHYNRFVSPRESCSFARAAADENCESRPADAATVAILRLLNGSKQEMQKLRHIGEQRAEEIAQSLLQSYCWNALSGGRAQLPSTLLAQLFFRRLRRRDCTA